MADDDTTYTIDEAARILRCSRWTLRDQVTRGEVPHHRVGRVKGVYFTAADLELIVATHERPSRRPSRRERAPVAASGRPAVSEIPPEFAKLRQAR